MRTCEDEAARPRTDCTSTNCRVASVVADPDKNRSVGLHALNGLGLDCRHVLDADVSGIERELADTLILSSNTGLYRISAIPTTPIVVSRSCCLFEGEPLEIAPSAESCLVVDQPFVEVAFGSTDLLGWLVTRTVERLVTLVGEFELVFRWCGANMCSDFGRIVRYRGRPSFADLP